MEEITGFNAQIRKRVVRNKFNQPILTTIKKPTATAIVKPATMPLRPATMPKAATIPETMPKAATMPLQPKKVDTTQAIEQPIPKKSMNKTLLIGGGLAAIAALYFFTKKKKK